MAATQDTADDDMLDIDLISSQPMIRSGQLAKTFNQTKANMKVLQYIETTYANIMSALENSTELRVVLDRPIDVVDSLRNDAARLQSNEDEALPKKQNGRRSVVYRWPGGTAEEAWRFACSLAVLAEIKTAIENGFTITKRDIYYRQPELFKKQQSVDQLIDTIAFSCNVTRRDLRVTASPKGLICGLTSNDEVLIVPEDSTIITSPTVSHLRWILVVEKEASFKTLVEQGFHRHPLLERGLIVTGKGYPDLNTKQLLRHILDNLPFQIPIFGLFDGDPDGLDVYRCYRVGSKRLEQEAACNIPEVKWLGVDVAEFLHRPLVMDEAVKMTSRDRGRAISMLKRRDVETANQSDHAIQRRRMLQHMLILNLKMEIQAVEKAEDGFFNWLAEKMKDLIVSL